MELTVEKVFTLLGKPVINVELSEEQVKIILNTSEVMANSLVKHFDKKELHDYVLLQLVLINCKKLWMSNVHKYDVKNISLSEFIYEQSRNDEERLFQLLGDE